MLPSANKYALVYKMKARTRFARRKSARRYARNKARSFLSTTLLLLGKPEAEPETTSTVTATSRAASYVVSFPRRENETIPVPGSDKSRGRHLGESPSFVRVVDGGVNAAPGGENAAADISVGLIGYLYAALVT